MQSWKITGKNDAEDTLLIYFRAAESAEEAAELVEATYPGTVALLVESMPETHRGFAIVDTGERVKLHGATWRVCEWLEGPNAGEQLVRPEAA